MRVVKQNKKYIHTEWLMKGGYTPNRVSFNTNKEQLVFGQIGWGVNNPRIAHELVNTREPQKHGQFSKYLDSAKNSNFINFLQTRKNEINHET